MKNSTCYVLFKHEGDEPDNHTLWEILKEVLSPFEDHTQNPKYLKCKQIKLDDYRKYFKKHYAQTGKYHTFEGWLDHIGCYKNKSGKWCQNVNPNGHFDWFTIGCDITEYIPTKDGRVNFCFKLENVLLRKPDDDGKIREIAEKMYFHMTRELPVDAELRKMYKQDYGHSPTASELSDFKRELRTAYTKEALDFGCDDAMRRVEVNKARFPTFMDYYEYCLNFVPNSYVYNGKWVERSGRFHFRSGETHDKIVKFAKSFNKVVNRCLKEGGWWMVSILPM